MDEFGYSLFLVTLTLASFVAWLESHKLCCCKYSCHSPFSFLAKRCGIPEEGNALHIDNVLANGNHVASGPQRFLPMCSHFVVSA